MRSRLTVLLRILLIAFTAACTRLPQNRADSDLQIGSANIGGVVFSVDDGLAHFTSAEDGQLTLWSQAPTLTIRVAASAAATEAWTLDIANKLPDAVLTATVNEQAISITDMGSSRPTSQRWRLQLTPGTDVVLLLSAADAGVRSPYQFVAMGDIQTGIPRVHELFARINQEDVRFVVSMGDLVELAKREEYEQIFQQFTTLDIPYYSTIGNHELIGDEGLWRQYFGRHNLHWSFKGVAFSLVDSGNASIDVTVYDWLDQWLDGARDDVHIFLTHFPPIDPVGVRAAAFRSRNEAAKLLSKLAAGNVDLTLYGHVHSHYVFDNAGIPARISGGGGAWPELMDGIGRHFLVVDVDPNVGVRNIRAVEID